jgi:hypothetical protein
LREERGRQKFDSQLDAKALMVVGFLCPISVEGVIRGLRWGIGPKVAEAISSHMDVHSIHRATTGRRGVCTDRQMYGRMDGMNIHM